MASLTTNSILKGKSLDVILLNPNFPSMPLNDAVDAPYELIQRFLIVLSEKKGCVSSRASTVSTRTRVWFIICPKYLT